MTTTGDSIRIRDQPTTTMAGVALTTITPAAADPIPTSASHGLAETEMAGPSTQRREVPTARQIEDLNFYLRRMNVGGNSDISQIESFGGGPDYEMFLDAVSSVGMQYDWTEAQIVRTVEMKLKDKAREYYGALLPAERPRTMVGMKQWFRRVFGRKMAMSAGKRELERCIRSSGEPLGEYAQRLKVIANKMFPVNTLITPEKLYHRNMLLVNQFVEGLDRRLANEILRAGEFYNLDECLEVAEECEEIVSRMMPEARYDTIRILETSERRGNTVPDQAKREDTAIRQYAYMDEEEGDIEPTRGAIPRRQPGRSSGGSRRNWQDREGPRTRRNGNYGGNITRSTPFLQKFPYMENRCVRCGDEGHIAVGCRKPERKFCYHCGRVGKFCTLNSTRPTLAQPR